MVSSAWVYALCSSCSLPKYLERWQAVLYESGWSVLMKGSKIPTTELNTVHFYQHYSLFMHNKLQYTWRGDYCECVRPAQLPVLTEVRAPSLPEQYPRYVPHRERAGYNTEINTLFSPQEIFCFFFFWYIWDKTATFSLTAVCGWSLESTRTILTCICLRRSVEKRKVTSSHPVLIRVWCNMMLEQWNLLETLTSALATYTHVWARNAVGGKGGGDRTKDIRWGDN